MRDYGVVHTDFWTDPNYAHLSATAKLIAVYLLTCPHTNMLGCFRLPLEYIAVDLSLDKKIISSVLQELIDANFLSIDFDHHWILIHSFLEWNPIENPNQAKHIIKIFEKISPALTVYHRLLNILETLSEPFNEAFRNRLQTLLEPFRNQKQNQEQKQEKDQKQNLCAEPKDSETVISVPTTGGGEYPIQKKQIDQWRPLYPAVDILQELRNIVGWNLANPTRRKTKSGILKHINRWLSKAQNQSSAHSHSSRSPPMKPTQGLYEYNKSIAESWANKSSKENEKSKVIDSEEDL